MNSGSNTGEYLGVVLVPRGLVRQGSAVDGLSTEQSYSGWRRKVELDGGGEE